MGDSDRRAGRDGLRRVGELRRDACGRRRVSQDGQPFDGVGPDSNPDYPRASERDAVVNDSDGKAAPLMTTAARSPATP